MTSMAFWLSYVALWLIASASFTAVFLLYRNEGRRILTKRGEGRGLQGPTLGKKAPVLDWRDLNDSVVSVGGVSDRPTMLFFGSPHCPPCRASLPFFDSTVARHRSVNAMVICRAQKAEARKFAEQAPSSRVLSDSSGAVAAAYKVAITPFVVVLDRAGIARSMGACSPSHESFEEIFKSAGLDSTERESPPSQISVSA